MKSDGHGACPNRMFTMSRVEPRRCASAFTLIEVLAVLGIIGILMSLILPAVHYARSRAWAAQCRSNLKQIGAAAGLYSADRDGILPAYCIKTDPADWTVGGTDWFGYYHWLHTNALPKYISGETLIASVDDPNNPVVLHNSVLTCMQLTHNIKTNILSYGINGFWTPDSLRALKQQSRMSRVKSPSDKVLFMDTRTIANPDGSFQSYPTFTKAAPLDYAEFRHPGDTLNALFVDGHVDSLNRDVFYPGGGSTPDDDMVNKHFNMEYQSN